MNCSNYIIRTKTGGGTGKGKLVRVCKCHWGQTALPPSIVGPLKKDYHEKPSQRGRTNSAFAAMIDARRKVAK